MEESWATKEKPQLQLGQEQPILTLATRKLSRKRHSRKQAKKVPSETPAPRLDAQEAHRDLLRRYKMAEVDRGLKLKVANPRAFRRLPQALQEAVVQYEDWLEKSAKEGPIFAELYKEQLKTFAKVAEAARIAYESWPREVKKFMAASESYPNSEWSNLSMPDLLEMVSILKKKGRPRAKETSEKIRLAAQCKAEGLSMRMTARRLFPELSLDVAYSRTRAFFDHYRQEIEAAQKRLKAAP